MGENRTLKRKNFISYQEVLSLDQGTKLGQLLDISTDGMRLLGQQQFTPEKHYSCRMVLNAEILGRSNILFDATCVWTRPDQTRHFFEAGFKSLTADPGDIDAIEMMVLGCGGDNL
jgi:hypothetical protein